MEVFGLRVLQLVLGWMPGLAAILVSAGIAGRAGFGALLRRMLVWRVHASWYLVASVGVVPIWLAAQALDPLLGGSGLNLPAPSPAQLALMGVQFAVRMVLSGEELGWRGFALPRLQERHGALLASLILGVIWACWHLPLFFVPGSQRDAGFPAFLLGTIGLSILFTWLFNNTGGSVLLCMVLHQSINTLTDVLGPTIPTADQLIFQWLFNGLYLGVAAMVVLMFGPARLSHAPASDAVIATGAPLLHGAGPG
jgi:membrane protease YdiL (CAAX protease family)